MDLQAADIFSGPSTSSQPTPGSGGRSADVDMAEADTQLSPEAFKQLQLEVERLGASGLDAKAQKQWKAQLMVRLGAKPEKVRRAFGIPLPPLAPVTLPPRGACCQWLCLR